MKYEPILICYILFFSELAVLPHNSFQIKLLLDNKNIFGEECKFLRKIPIFGNFGPLGAAEDLKIFQKFFSFFSTHTKRQLFFAITF